MCHSIWLGANSIKLSRCGGELGGGELAMGRNWQLPFSPPVVGCLFKKGLQKGGSWAPQHPPSYALEGLSNMRSE